MSYEKRRVELMKCDCITGINELGECVCFPVETVHCENRDGYMRCEVCGKVKDYVI